MIIGSCSQQELKFYYDKSQQQCQPFLYSGCDGNENNFQTLNECSLKCGKPVVHDVKTVTEIFYLLIYIGCPQNESSIVECDADPCLSSTCLSAPTAKCFSDYCGNCTSRYYFNEQEVTDTCCKLKQFLLSSLSLIFFLLSCFQLAVMDYNQSHVCRLAYPLVKFLSQPVLHPNHVYQVVAVLMILYMIRQSRDVSLLHLVVRCVVYYSSHVGFVSILPLIP